MVIFGSHSHGPEEGTDSRRASSQKKTTSSFKMCLDIDRRRVDVYFHRYRATMHTVCFDPAFETSESGSTATTCMSWLPPGVISHKNTTSRKHVAWSPIRIPPTDSTSMCWTQECAACTRFSGQIVRNVRHPASGIISRKVSSQPVSNLRGISPLGGAVTATRMLSFTRSFTRRPKQQRTLLAIQF